jgi:hypothetical protein
VVAAAALPAQTATLSSNISCCRCEVNGFLCSAARPAGEILGKNLHCPLAHLERIDNSN